MEHSDDESPPDTPPGRFYAGTIKKVQVHLAPSTLSASDQQKLRDTARDAAMERADMDGVVGRVEAAGRIAAQPHLAGNGVDLAEELAGNHDGVDALVA